MSKKYVRETTAGKAISAYVIMKGARQVAVIQVFHGATCLVNVWQETAAYIRSAKARKVYTTDESAYHDFQFQRSTASGYGYDKETSALAGLIIDGHELTDHCGRLKAPKPPKGRKLFPHNSKAPRGYSFANFTSIDKESGRRIYRDEWHKRAAEALGIVETPENANEVYAHIAEKARQMESDWRASDQCESGYSDCYRESGLKYLKALGYTVINAI
jgi:hypothetical protein